MSGGDICEYCGDWRPCGCDQQLEAEVSGDDPEMFESGVSEEG